MVFSLVYPLLRELKVRKIKKTENSQLFKGTAKINN